MPARKYKMDVVGRLSVFRSVCENVYHVPAEMKRTYRNVPYVKVGSGRGVRIVLFVASHQICLFFNPKNADQMKIAFPMDRGPGGKWMSNEFINRVCAMACGVAEGLETNGEIALI